MFRPSSFCISVRRREYMKGSTARSAFAVLLGLSILVPLMNYYRVLPSATLYSEAASAILFLGAAAIGSVLVERRSALHGSIVVFVVGLFALLALQVASGRYVYVLSLSGWFAYLAVFFVAAAIGQAAASDLQLRSLIVDRVTFALLLTALFNAFAQTAQSSGLADDIRMVVLIPAEWIYEKYKCSPAGNVAQLNHANVLAWLGVGSLLYQIAAKRLRPSLGAAGLAILLFSSALTSSRMAWLMAMAVALLVVLGNQSLGWSRQRSLFAAGALVLGFLAATLAKKLVVGDGCETSFDRVFTAEPRLDYWVRLEMMRQALLVWWSQPVLGVGVGNFMAAAFALEPDLHTVRPLDYFPHNAPLEILASFGLFGGGLLLGCGAVWAFRAWRHLHLSAEQWPMVAGLVVLLIHSLLEMPLWYAFFLIPFGLMLGVAIGPAGAGQWSMQLPLRWIFVASAIVGMPAFAYVVVDHAKAERALWLSEMARMNKHVSGAAVEQLAGLSGELTVFRIAAEREVLRFAQINRANLDGLRTANARLLNSMPDPLTISREILIEAMEGNTEKARDLFRRLMVFYPKNWQELAEEIRKRVEEHPEEFGELTRVLDEEASRPPQRRR